MRKPSRSKTLRLIRFGFTAVLLVDLICPRHSRAAGLSPEDEARIRAVSKAYCDGWLSKDAEERVLRLFAKDAVLLPHHGLEPVTGEEAMRRFWFPKGGPVTTVTKLTQSIDEIGGSGDVAYMRGHHSVSWTSGSGPGAPATSLSGTFLMILRRQPDGSWRITHHMWDDPPPPR